MIPSGVMMPVINSAGVTSKPGLRAPLVPITDAPVRRGTGPVSDLKVTFPTSGLYQFTFDERRLTFSIKLATAPSRAAHSASRRIR